jgi:hypothetical protein
MAIAAYTATLTAGGTTVHDIDTHDLPFKMDMLDVTAFSGATAGTYAYLPALLGLQAKFSGNWNKGDTAQLALETAFFGRTAVAFVVSPNNGTNSYSFSGYISDYDVKSGIKDKVTCDYTVYMNGGCTIV